MTSIFMKVLSMSITACYVIAALLIIRIFLRKEIETYTDGDEYVTEYEYDGKGNVIKKIRTYPDGDKYVTEYEYDDQGNVIKEIETYTVGGQRVTEYKYDDKGNEIKDVHTDSDGTQEVTEYEYDEKGRKTKEVEVGYKTIEYEYNDKENKVKETLYYDNKVEEIVEWTLDEQGRKIHGKLVYSLWDVEECYFENEYDEKGNLIKEIFPKDYCSMRMSLYDHNEHGDVVKKMHDWFDVGEGYVIDNVTEYDKDEKEIKKVVTYSNGKQNITEWQYDDKGNLLKEITAYSDGKQDINEWQYDDKGNLIKETVTKDGEVDHTTEYSGYVYFEVDDAS